MTSRSATEREVAARLGSAAEARWVVAHGGDVDAIVERRLSGEPLQYVLGEWSFRTLELVVDPRALIPRPETEQVVEAGLGAIAGRSAPVVVDLGTGSGAIALSVVAERPDATVWATDADAGALALAEENARRTGLTVGLRLGSWFDAVPASLRGRVDLVVSNPPYVSEDEWTALDPEVRREPRTALVAGPGSDGTPGLAAVETVLTGSTEWLAASGAVVVEIAPHQADAAADVAERVGLREVRVVRDLSDRDRAVVGRR